MKEGFIFLITEFVDLFPSSNSFSEKGLIHPFNSYLFQESVMSNETIVVL
jgi:hypothetical protein